MAYGTVKTDTIIFDQGGADQNVTVSGIYRAITSGVTVSGTIAGAVLIGTTTVSGTTVTGTTANFVSGVFTTVVSGATVTGNQSSFTSGNFVTLSGVTATFTSGVIASGTAAAPSLSIISDPNTGLYSPGADQVALATAGTGRLFVDGSGRLSLGVSSTSRVAEFACASGNNGVRITNNANTASDFAVLDLIQAASQKFVLYTNQENTTLNANTGALIFQTGAAERVRIDSSGRVGIGTSTPQGTLSVSNAGAAGLEFTPYSTYTELLSVNRSTSAYIPFASFASTHIWHDSTGERARIDSSGRLLVATNTPRLISSAFMGGGGATADFQVEGQFLAIGSFSSNRNDSFGPYLAFVKSRGTTTNSFTLVNNGDVIGALSFNGTDGSAALAGAAITALVDGTPGVNDMPGCLVFSTTADGASIPTERLRIGSNGNVGIGTSSPAEKLQVDGNIALDNSVLNTPKYIHFRANAVATEYGGIKWYNFQWNSTVRASITSGPDGAVASGYLAFSTGISGLDATEKMRIDSSGRVGIGLTSPGANLHVNNIGALASVPAIGSLGGLFNATVGTNAYGLISGALNSGAYFFQSQTTDGTSATYSILLNPNGGNVGIGTTSPNTRLHVFGGDLKIQKSSANLDSVSEITLSNTYRTGRILSSYTNPASITETYIAFHTNRTGEANDTVGEVMRIAGGSVGIGTSAPGANHVVEIVGNRKYVSIYPNTGSEAGALGTVNPSSSSGLFFGWNRSNGEGESNIVYGVGAGASPHLQIASWNGTTYTERLRIDSSGRLLVGSSSARSLYGQTGVLQTEGLGYASSGINLILNNASTAGPLLMLGKSRGSAIGSNTIVQNGDTLGMIFFCGADGSDLDTPGGGIYCEVDGTPGANDMPGRLVFATTADGAGAPTERMRIESNGNTRFSNLATLYPATDNAVTNGGSGFRWSQIWAANGTIQTSDERAKTEITNAVIGSNFIKALRPVSYKWIEGGKRDTGERDEDGNYIYESVPGERTHWGFIAQEVKEAVDSTGVDFGGWVLTDKDDPDSQQALRYDQFIAPLTKALQEAIGKIETLEARLTAAGID
jgi:hypothetical protein